MVTLARPEAREEGAAAAGWLLAPAFEEPKERGLEWQQTNNRHVSNPTSRSQGKMKKKDCTLFAVEAWQPAALFLRQERQPGLGGRQQTRDETQADPRAARTQPDPPGCSR